jgi:hypothetical protein
MSGLRDRARKEQKLEGEARVQKAALSKLLQSLRSRRDQVSQLKSELEESTKLQARLTQEKSGHKLGSSTSSDCKTEDGTRSSDEIDGSCASKRQLAPLYSSFCSVYEKGWPVLSGFISEMEAILNKGTEQKFYLREIEEQFQLCTTIYEGATEIYEALDRQYQTVLQWVSEKNLKGISEEKLEGFCIEVEEASLEKTKESLTALDSRVLPELAAIGGDILGPLRN